VQALFALGRADEAEKYLLMTAEIDDVDLRPLVSIARALGFDGAFKHIVLKKGCNDDPLAVVEAQLLAGEQMRAVQTFKHAMAAIVEGKRDFTQVRERLQSRRYLRDHQALLSPLIAEAEKLSLVRQAELEAKKQREEQRKLAEAEERQRLAKQEQDRRAAEQQEEARRRKAKLDEEEAARLEEAALQALRRQRSEQRWILFGSVVMVAAFLLIWVKTQDDSDRRPTRTPGAVPAPPAVSSRSDAIPAPSASNGLAGQDRARDQRAAQEEAQAPQAAPAVSSEKPALSIGKWSGTIADGSIRATSSAQGPQIELEISTTT
jgi:protein required for attachment to host cells